MLNLPLCILWHTDKHFQIFQILVLPKGGTKNTFLNVYHPSAKHRQCQCFFTHSYTHIEIERVGTQTIALDVRSFGNSLLGPECFGYHSLHNAPSFMALLIKVLRMVDVWTHKLGLLQFLLQLQTGKDVALLRG